MPMSGGFDATQFEPKQGGEAHPIGKFPATVSNTSIESNKAQDGGMFVVEFTTPAGSIVSRYNLWNKNAQAVEIAHGQLSALCHATGVFRLDWQNDGAAMRNARCQIEVANQLDKETKQPNGYVQVKKIYDANGNEPGKVPAAPQPAAAAAPMTQQSSGGWSNGNAQAAPAPQVNAGAAPAWQQGQAAPAAGASGKPPWAS